MSKLKLPIIIAVVLAAAGAGLFFSGIVGGKDAPSKKYVVEPIALAEPFLIRLADTDGQAFLAANVALQLEPMNDVHWAAFTGGEGGHGGATAPPGPIKVASYPKFRDAMLTVASSFKATDLNTPEGKEALRAELLDRFHEIAETDAAELKSSASANDPTHLGPPYHVMDVFFTKYVIQS